MLFCAVVVIDLWSRSISLALSVEEESMTSTTPISVVASLMTVEGWGKWIFFFFR